MGFLMRLPGPIIYTECKERVYNTFSYVCICILTFFYRPSCAHSLSRSNIGITSIDIYICNTNTLTYLHVDDDDDIVDADAASEFLHVLHCVSALNEGEYFSPFFFQQFVHIKVPCNVVNDADG